MTDLYDISVIICVYNGEKVIGEQLDALRHQHTDLQWEVVVADNGSQDRTREVVAREAMNFPVPLRVVDASQKRGAGAARNAGAIAALSQKLAFCDCDDHVASTWVQAAYDALDEHPVVGGLNRELRTPFDPDAPVMNEGCVVPGTFGNGVMSGNSAFRRDVFFRSGGFDTSLPPYGIEDFELSVRVYTRAHSYIAAAPDMLIYYRATEDKRILLKKVYMAASAEVLVWHRHPEIYPGLTSLPRLTAKAATLPGKYIEYAVRGTMPAPQKIARDVVTRYANLLSEVKVRLGKVEVGRVELLEPSDDPLRATS